MSKHSKTEITRWEFIRDASAATLGGSLLLGSGRQLLAATEDTAATATSAVTATSVRAGVVSPSLHCTKW